MKYLFLSVSVHINYFETSNCILYDQLRLCKQLIFLGLAASICLDSSSSVQLLVDQKSYYFDF